MKTQIDLETRIAELNRLATFVGRKSRLLFSLNKEIAELMKELDEIKKGDHF